MKVAILHGDVAPDAPADELDTMVQVEAVDTALRALGHTTARLAFGPRNDRVTAALEGTRADAVFNLVESVEGSSRELHTAPAMIESLGLACTGASANAIVATANKTLTKPALASAGIPTPRWFRPGVDDRLGAPFAGPYIVKSIWEHASIGLDDSGVVSEHCEVTALLARRNGARGGPWFVERYIEGRELVATLLAGPDGPEVVAISEMVFADYPAGKPRILGYAAKWDASSFEHAHTVRRFLGPNDEPELARRLAEMALGTWRAFELNGYARIDFRVDSAGDPWVVDVNTNPGIAPDSGFVAATESRGIAFDEVVRRILADAH